MSRLFESSKLKRQWPENLRNSNKMGWPTGTEEVGGAWYSYRNPLGSSGSSKQEKATKTFGIQDVQVPDCLQRSRPGGGSKHRCEKQQVEGSRKKDTGLESQDYSGSWVPNPNSESLGQTGEWPIVRVLGASAPDPPYPERKGGCPLLPPKITEGY